MGRKNRKPAALVFSSSILSNALTENGGSANENGMFDSPVKAEIEDHDGPANLMLQTRTVDRLGRGAGGIVYLGIYLPLLKLVAVKEVGVHDDMEKRMISNELHAMHANLVPINEHEDVLTWVFDHHKNIGTVHPCPYIVSFYGSYSTPDLPKVSIVLEYMNGGSLQDLVGIKVPEVVLKQIAYCCTMALEHMHGYRMLHRDIKPANILSSHECIYKIADFGLATTLSKSKTHFSDFKGTMMYMAPERITGKEYSYASDTWSLGMVLLTLALGKFPFNVQDGFFGLEEAIVNERLPDIPKEYSPECRDFIQMHLNKDPHARICAQDASKHAFLTSSSRKQDAEKAWQTICPTAKHLNQDNMTTISNLVMRNEHIKTRRKSIEYDAVSNIQCSNLKPSFLVNCWKRPTRITQRNIQHLAKDSGVEMEQLELMLQKVQLK